MRLTGFVDCETRGAYGVQIPEGCIARRNTSEPKITSAGKHSPKEQSYSNSEHSKYESSTGLCLLHSGSECRKFGYLSTFCDATPDSLVTEISLHSCLGTRLALQVENSISEVSSWCQLGRNWITGPGSMLHGICKASIQDTHNIEANFQN